MATYIVPTDKKPSFFNRQAVIGGLLGTLVGQTGFGAVLGASLGAVIGRTGEAIEERHGHVVREPNIVNDYLGIGALTGGLVAGLTVATFGLGLAASVAVGAGLMALGAYVGGKAGEAGMKKEYEQAERLALEGKAKVVGMIDLSQHPEQAEIYGKKPTLNLPQPASQPLALPEPQMNYRTDHAARIREQQAVQITGRPV